MRTERVVVSSSSGPSGRVMPRSCRAGAPVTGPYDAAVAADGSYALDRVLIPAKRLVYNGLCRGDYGRYLALRARAVAVVGRLGLYERETGRAVRTLVRPGDVAVDVGASFGAYTALLARLVGPAGRVDAFEPQSDVFAHLSARVSGVPNVHLVHAGVADHSGVGHMVVPAIAGGIPETALGSLQRDDSGTPADTESIPVTTLDEHCRGFDRLNFLKVDVEGGDLDVLRGGRDTLQRLRPVIQFECNDPADLPPFTAFAAELGYRIGDEVYNGANRFMLLPS